MKAVNTLGPTTLTQRKNINVVQRHILRETDTRLDVSTVRRPSGLILADLAHPGLSQREAPQMRFHHHHQVKMNEETQNNQKPGLLQKGGTMQTVFICIMYLIVLHQILELHVFIWRVHCKTVYSGDLTLTVVRLPACSPR